MGSFSEFESSHDGREDQRLLPRAGDHQPTRGLLHAHPSRRTRWDEAQHCPDGLASSLEASPGLPPTQELHWWDRSMVLYHWSTTDVPKTGLTWRWTAPFCRNCARDDRSPPGSAGCQEHWPFPQQPGASEGRDHRRVVDSSRRRAPYAAPLPSHSTQGAKALRLMLHS